MRLSQVQHFNPISAPIRTTVQSWLPQGCGFLRRTLSPTAMGVIVIGAMHVIIGCVFQAVPADQFGKLEQSMSDGEDLIM